MNAYRQTPGSDSNVGLDLHNVTRVSCTFTQRACSQLCVEWVCLACTHTHTRTHTHTHTHTRTHTHTHTHTHKLTLRRIHYSNVTLNRGWKFFDLVTQEVLTAKVL